jgi:hypothetical protein
MASSYLIASWYRHGPILFHVTWKVNCSSNRRLCLALAHRTTNDYRLNFKVRNPPSFGELLHLYMPAVISSIFNRISQ